MPAQGEDRDLIGQLFMVDFGGPSPSDEITRLIADGGVGGIVLFDKNVRDPGQVASLTNALQRHAAAVRRPPLLVAADQEGGPVVRLRGTHFPSAMAFGAAGSDDLVAAAAEATARELRAVGIHVNFAPDLDVNSNPANPVIGVRSYGEDPALVARLGTRAVTAMQAGGVLATAKHFPGHGDTAQDSHLALPTVGHPRDRLEAIEFPPFREAIGAGVAAVMTAHVVYPALDPDHPATLSPAIIGMLRAEMGFGGIVVSDSMRMRAIADLLGPGEAAVQAVLAGVDLVLALGPAEVQWEALRAVRAAAAGGRIPEARIREAADRVVAAKRRLGLFDNAFVQENAVPRRVGLPEHTALAGRVAAAAATLVRGQRGMPPLPPGSIQVAAGLAPQETTERLAQALRAKGRTAMTVGLDRGGDRGAAPDRTAPIVLPLADSAPGGPVTRERILAVTAAALKRGPVVVVATAAPYALAHVPQECAALAVYGADPSTLQAAAAVLTGAVRPGGRLPVTIASPTAPEV